MPALSCTRCATTCTNRAKLNNHLAASHGVGPMVGTVGTPPNPNRTRGRAPAQGTPPARASRRGQRNGGNNRSVRLTFEFRAPTHTLSGSSAWDVWAVNPAEGVLDGLEAAALKVRIAPTPGDSQGRVLWGFGPTPTDGAAAALLPRVGTHQSASLKEVTLTVPRDATNFWIGCAGVEDCTDVAVKVSVLCGVRSR